MRERRAKWFIDVAIFSRSSFTNAQIEAKMWLLWVLIPTFRTPSYVVQELAMCHDPSHERDTDLQERDT